MKCLVTGANGFIGSCLVQKLIAEGHSVRCLVRENSNCEYLKELPVEYSQGSLFDHCSLCHAVDGVDYIFNFAGKTRALKNSDYFLANATGAKNLFQAAQEAAPKIRGIVHVSSLAAIGPAPQETPLSEDAVPNPVTPYGASKLESEKIAYSYMDKLPITIIRPPVVFGPRDRSGLAMFKSAAKGYNLAIANCDPLLVPIYVQDLVDGCYLLSQHPRAANEAFFLTGDEVTTPHGLFSILSQAMPTTRQRTVTLPYWLACLAVYALELRAQVIRKPNRLNSAKLTEIRHYSWLASNAKAKNFGFSPLTPLQTGLLNTMKWYQDAGWLA